MKLKALKPLFKQLNNEEFRNITQRIDKARTELVMIQKQLTSKCTDNLVEQEKNTIQILEKWTMIEENIMKQKSRAKWIQLGDSNTKYFLAVVKERSQRKTI